MPDDITLRRYESIDKEAVFNLHVLAISNVKNLPYVSGPWEDDLNNIKEVYLDNGGEFLVAEINGEIIAMGALQRISERCAEIKRMRVHPNYWRRGIGQAILSRLEVIAKEKGYQVLELDTTIYQESAQRLYLKNNYREVRRGKRGPFESIFYEKEI